MIYIFVHYNDFISEFEEESDSKDTTLGDYRVLRFKKAELIPFNLLGHKRFTKEDLRSLKERIESGYSISEKKPSIVNQPFASKELESGQSIFLRTHGVEATIPANSSDSLDLVVPYTLARINEVEVVENVTAKVDFKVVMPDGETVANHFGKDVCLGERVFSKKSSYDAELMQGLILRTELQNKSNEQKVFGVNYILHEVK